MSRKMTPKQRTMERICDILHAEARADGMGLDRESFSRKYMRKPHAFLLTALTKVEDGFLSTQLSAGREA